MATALLAHERVSTGTSSVAGNRDKKRKTGRNPLPAKQLIELAQKVAGRMITRSSATPLASVCSASRKNRCSTPTLRIGTYCGTPGLREPDLSDLRL